MKKVKLKRFFVIPAMCLALLLVANPASAFFVYANLSTNGTTFNKNQNVNFKANWGGDQAPYTVRLNCGNGDSWWKTTSTNSETWTCKYSSSGSYTATLAVTGKSGSTASDQVKIRIR